MKALVFHGPGNLALEDIPSPSIEIPTDAIVKIIKTTICGTDLHIMKGDVPTVIANIGVHGKPVQLNIDKLWSHNITLTTRLVDTVTTPMLLKTVMSGKVQSNQLITHHFTLTDIMQAYKTFGNEMRERALKVIITNNL